MLCYFEVGEIYQQDVGVSQGLAHRRRCVWLQAVIPMSSSAKHIAQNKDVFSFSLSPGEMRQLDEMDGTLTAT